MDTERNLLFGIVAFQNGAVDAQGLAETCAAWTAEPTLPLATLMVDRGFMTDEQRTAVEHAVEQELAAHGGDPQTTLAASLDGRSVEAIGPLAGVGVAIAAPPVPPAGPGGGGRAGEPPPGGGGAPPPAPPPPPPPPS